MGIITFQHNSELSYDQWKLKRNESIGSSEVGAICFGSAYTSNLEIFYNKVAGAKDTVENIRMWLGKKTEPLSQEMWSYYEYDSASIVKNSRAGKHIRMGENRNVTIFNSDHPGRSSTPDVHILPYGIYAGRGEGYCEIKNTQSFVLKSYENQLPTENVFQLCDQTIIGDKQYGELFYFIDNRDFALYPLERRSMKNIEQIIIRETGKLWKSILKARPLYNQMYNAKMNHNYKLANELDHEIQQLEPAPQNSIGYLNFLTQRYKDRVAGVGIIEGNDTQLAIAKKHKDLVAKIDKLEKQKRHLEIELKLILKDNNILNFGRAGQITNFANKNGSRLFKNNIN